MTTFLIAKDSKQIPPSTAPIFLLIAIVKVVVVVVVGVPWVVLHKKGVCFRLGGLRICWRHTGSPVGRLCSIRICVILASDYFACVRIDQGQRASHCLIGLLVMCLLYLLTAARSSADILWRLCVLLLLGEQCRSVGMCILRYSWCSRHNHLAVGLPVRLAIKCLLYGDCKFELA